MKIFLQATGFKILLFANLIWLGLMLLSKAISAIKNILKAIPFIGKGLSAGFSFITTPLTFLASISKIVIIIDIVLLVIFLISFIVKMFRKRKRIKAIKTHSKSEEVVEESSEEKESTLLKLMNVFK